MTKVAVVILHYKGEEDTLKCIDSLFREHPNRKLFKLIVVSNASSEKFCFRLKRNYANIEVIENQENLGFSKGNNIGIKKALVQGCEFIILLNNDTIVGPKLVENLVSFAKTNVTIGLVSPKIYFAPGNEYHKNRYKDTEKGKVIWYAGGILDWQNVYASHRGVDQKDSGRFGESVDTDFVTGCCVLIKKAVIEKIGFLDEKYFLYFEDIDYSIRAKRGGFRVVYYPGTHIWHKNASSSGDPGSPIHIYYQTRNRLYFGYKYASWRTKKALFFESLKLFLKGGIRGRAIKDYYLGKMEKR